MASIIWTLGIDGAQFQRGLNAAKQAIAGFAGSVKTQLAGAFSIGAMGYGIKVVLEYAGALTDLSARTGVSVEALQRFDHAVRNNGSSLETLVGFWEQLALARQKALNDPKGADAKAFGRLGITPGQIASASPQEITKQITAAFKTTVNVDEIVGPLKEIGGRSATELIAAFKSGMDEGLENLSVMSDEQADALDDLGEQWTNLTRELTVGVAPALAKVVEGFRTFQAVAGISITIITELVASLKTIPGIADRIYNPKNWSLNPIANHMGAIRDVGSMLDKASNEVVNNIIDVAKGYVANNEDASASDAAARASRIASRLNRGKYQFTADDQKEKMSKLAAFKPTTDSLIGVGNFLGSGRSVVESIARAQLKTLKQIAANTTPRRGPTITVPGSTTSTYESGSGASTSGW